MHQSKFGYNLHLAELNHILKLIIRGYLGPGGLHDNASYINCTGGAAGFIDRDFFGTGHIYKTPTPKVLKYYIIRYLWTIKY